MFNLQKTIFSADDEARSVCWLSCLSWRRRQQSSSRRPRKKQCYVLLVWDFLNNSFLSLIDLIISACSDPQCARTTSRCTNSRLKGRARMPRTRCGCLTTSSLWMVSKTMRYSVPLFVFCTTLKKSSYIFVLSTTYRLFLSNRHTRSLSYSSRSPINGSPTMPQRETRFSSRFGRCFLVQGSLS